MALDPQLQALVNLGLGKGAAQKLLAVNNPALISSLTTALGEEDEAKFNANKQVKLSTAQLRDAAESIFGVPDASFDKLSSSQLKNLFASTGRSNVEIAQSLGMSIPPAPAPRPAPSPTPGGIFGITPTPSRTPAPTPGGIFGITPTPAPAPPPSFLDEDAEDQEAFDILDRDAARDLAREQGIRGAGGLSAQILANRLGVAVRKPNGDIVYPSGTTPPGDTGGGGTTGGGTTGGGTSGAPTVSNTRRAESLYDLYAPAAKTDARVQALAEQIGSSSFNRAKFNWLNRPGEDAELAAAFAASPAAQGFARPTYQPQVFSGIAGLDPNNPALRELPANVRANVATSALGTQQAGGSIPFAYQGAAAPDVYAGVPEAAARPLANVSPEDLGAYDVALANAVNRATGYADVFGNPVNEAGLEAAAARGTPAAAPLMAAAPVSMKEGGIASLADDAEAVRGAGRYGDDRLVHVNSEELGIMQGMFGKPTINPKTGMPEFFLGGLFKSIGKILKKVVSVAAKVVPFIAPFIPGIGPIAQAGIAGLAGGFGKDGFDLKRGLLSGLLSFGAGQAFSGLKAAAGAGSAASNVAAGAANVADDIAAAGLSSAAPTSAAQALAPQAAAGSVLAPQAARTGIGAAFQQPVEAAIAPTLSGGAQSAVQALAPAVTPAIASAAAPSVLSQIGSNVLSSAQQAGTGLQNLISGSPEALAAFKNQFGTGSALSLAAGASGINALNEQQKFEEEQEALLAEQRERERAAEQSAFEAMRRFPFRFASFESGGSVDDQPGYDMAKGGMPPRYLNGPGDGMSDSIKANIDGKREARLADGEFVIPADVVSHLGNGSSKAGAKRLYDMMDRVRKARTGTKRQGREINPMRMMPA